MNHQGGIRDLRRHYWHLQTNQQNEPTHTQPSSALNWPDFARIFEFRNHKSRLRRAVLGREETEETCTAHSQELFQLHLPLPVLDLQLVIIRTELLLFQLQFLIQTEMRRKRQYVVHQSEIPSPIAKYVVLFQPH